VRRRPWKLEVIEALAVAGAAADDPVASRLTQVGAIGLASADEVTAAIERLRTADQRVTSMSGTPAGDAHRIGSLLALALAHQASHPGQPCPVCRGRVLDDQWAEFARTEIDRLNKAAGEADTAHMELAAATPGNARPSGRRSRCPGPGPGQRRGRNQDARGGKRPSGRRRHGNPQLQ
jgi:hypothetical protein